MLSCNAKVMLNASWIEFSIKSFPMGEHYLALGKIMHLEFKKWVIKVLSVKNVFGNWKYMELVPNKSFGIVTDSNAFNEITIEVGEDKGG